MKRSFQWSFTIKFPAIDFIKTPPQPTEDAQLWHKWLDENPTKPQTPSTEGNTL